MTIAERHPVGTGYPEPAATEQVADLRRTWLAMTSLRSAEPAASQPVLSPDLAVAVDILSEAVHRPGPSGARRVPSAGAIFPYETLALCRTPAVDDSDSGWQLFRIEGALGSCTRVPAARPWLHRLAGALPGGPGFDGCYLLVLTRPWLSIRKYGPRGYLYTQLDAAHAAVNILGVALSTGLAVLHTRLPAAADAALRSGFSRFHEPHSVIRLTRVRSYPGNAVVTVRDEAPVRRGPNSYDFEAQAWASIVAPLHTDLLPDAGPARDGILLELPEPRADLALRAEWRELSAVRRSAKRFGAEPLTGARLAATVGALATPLPTTFAPDPADRLPADRSAVSATVIVNDRLELSPAEHRSITRCARLVRYPTGSDSAPVEVGSFIAACMGQPHVGHGQAFVLLHATAELVAEGLTGHHLRQALFRAGAGAQLLCLAATRDRIAASTIGGFDSAVWARIGQLPEDTELLYLLVLGAPEAENGPARADRGEKATAHGES